MALAGVCAVWGGAAQNSADDLQEFCRDADMLVMLVETKPPVVSFHFGLPSADAVLALRACGIFLLATATCLEEARAIEEAGIEGNQV
jgi:nitronate monooxygenase